jgi:hypothetical protein
MKANTPMAAASSTAAASAVAQRMLRIMHDRLLAQRELADRLSAQRELAGRPTARTLSRFD